ncbi:hypothetical protein [Iodobacter fluviatilis]|uniref:Uncharacterized protein n=1 Tax=Iodobacter fluviatilis TaxID=537 RepID=A0A377QCD4_9NEIS|nr:hypothetical protein [Iodobacter fluviatilis]TCU81926.1 hypothetical protein EV682_11847 [Iodobacter fluviatilis]STQ91541.1 Uncharacterised protein [Iodobacter fluviatilis]
MLSSSLRGKCSACASMFVLLEYECFLFDNRIDLVWERLGSAQGDLSVQFENSSLRDALDWLVRHGDTDEPLIKLALDVLLDETTPENALYLEKFLSLNPVLIGKKIQQLMLDLLIKHQFLNDENAALAKPHLEQAGSLSHEHYLLKDVLNWLVAEGYSSASQVQNAIDTLLAEYAFDADTLLRMRPIDPERVNPTLHPLLSQRYLQQLQELGFLAHAQYQNLQAHFDEGVLPEYDDTSINGLLDYLIASHYIQQQEAEQRKTYLFSGQVETSLLTESFIHALKALDLDRTTSMLQVRLEQNKASDKRIVRWGCAALVLFIVGVIGFKGLKQQPVTEPLPATTLLCNAENVESSVSVTLYQIEAKNNLFRPSANKNKEQQRSHIHPAEEIGYDKLSRSRACRVVFESEGEKIALGYLIAPEKEKEKTESFSLTFKPVDYLNVRFGPKALDPALSGPLSGEVLNQAVRDGLKSIDAAMDNKLARGLKDKTSRVDGLWGVLPDGKCTSSAKEQLSCPVLIDYTDSLLSALGGSAEVQFKATIDLKQVGDKWVVGDDFISQFMKPLALARAKKMVAGKGF